MKATESEIRELRTQIRQWDLLRVARFNEATVAELMEIFNGVGPDNWPEELRHAFDVALHHFLPAVLIHDFDFEVLKRTERSFMESNNRLYENCKICAKKEFPAWWQFAPRWMHYRMAHAVYMACKEFGRDAFFHKDD